MVSERQKIEAPPTPAAESYMPPPPSYDEVDDMFASTSADQSVNSVEFFLGEVRHLRTSCQMCTKLSISGMLIKWVFVLLVMQALDSFKAESEFELNLSVGDIVIVRKVTIFFVCLFC